LRLSFTMAFLGTAFAYSLALEMLGFFGEDVQEGLDAVRERRDPKFPSAQ